MSAAHGVPSVSRNTSARPSPMVAPWRSRSMSQAQPSCSATRAFSSA
ncbi:hypothetical protein [Amycolatopsis sp. cmx-4-61]